MVAVGVKEEHPRKGRHALGGFLIAGIAVARHPVDGVRHRRFAQLQSRVQIIQSVTEIKHSLGFLMIQHPAQVAQAAVHIADDKDLCGFRHESKSFLEKSEYPRGGESPPAYSLAINSL